MWNLQTFFERLAEWEDKPAIRVAEWQFAELDEINNDFQQAAALRGFDTQNRLLGFELVDGHSNR